MAQAKDYKLGPSTFPRGWFMIAPSEELGEAPLPLRYFAQDMVLYRGASGRLVLAEAYCPHMGAHLACNTTSYIVRDGMHIEGDSIRCPFHGWRYGPDGQCDDIPYSDFIPKTARLKTWPVVERAGIIWMWHDEEGGEPDFPLPEFAIWDDPAWVRWKIDIMGELEIHPIEIVDNMADLAHMVPVHGSVDCAYFDNEFEGVVAIQRLTAGHRVLASSDAAISYETWYTGPALLQSELEGELPALMLITHTPIEDGKVRMWHALMVQSADPAQPEKGVAIARAYQEASRSTLAQDLELWNAKKAIIQPLIIPKDGPVGKVRQWYSQFYQPRHAAMGTQQRINGKVVSLDTSLAV